MFNRDGMFREAGSDFRGRLLRGYSTSAPPARKILGPKVTATLRIFSYDSYQLNWHHHSVNDTQYTAMFLIS